MKKIKLTQQEDEWLTGNLPVENDFPVELLFKHRPDLVDLLQEMRSTYKEFNGLWETINEVAWGAWNDLTYDEQQKYRRRPTWGDRHLDALVALDPKPEKEVRRG